MIPFRDDQSEELLWRFAMRRQWFWRSVGLLLTTLILTGCKPVASPPPATITPDDLKAVKEDILASIPRQSAPVDLEPIEQSITNMEKRLLEKMKAAQPRSYAMNDAEQQVIYYLTTDNCVPCVQFHREGPSVRINGRPVDWRPVSECPHQYTAEELSVAPAFFWYANGTWWRMTSWLGPIDFQARFASTTGLRSGLRTSPLTFTTYSSEPVVEPIVFSPVIRTIGRPVVRVRCFNGVCVPY